MGCKKVKCCDCKKFGWLYHGTASSFGMCPRRQGKQLNADALRNCVSFEPIVPVCEKYDAESGSCYSLQAPEDRFGAPCPCKGRDDKHECIDYEQKPKEGAMP